MPESSNTTLTIVKDRWAEPGSRPEGVAVVNMRLSVLLGVLFGVAAVLAQELPVDELQVNFSSYFDNFHVTVIYPNFSLTRRVLPSTAITGRYLVDLISAASIRSNAGQGGTTPGEEEDDDDGLVNPKVDAVTQASGRGSGVGSAGTANTLRLTDDVRNELGLGVTQLIPGGTFTFNGLYSKEHDYSSGTIAGTISRNFAQNNTTLELGFVRSWDRVFPVTKDWTRDVNVETANATFSQILSTRLITQFIFSYTNTNGQLADVYRFIKIPSGDSTIHYDPVHPYNRQRRALANNVVYRLNAISSLTMGYRYYWDSWDIRSHTISGLYQRHTTRYTILGIGFRGYVQNQAFFFKSEYTQPEQYMTADNKLDNIYSTELQFKLSLDGGGGRDYLPFLEDDRVQYNFGLNWYQRHTGSPDWFSHSRNLTAIYLNVGIRYRF